ncbi:MAG TPA: leucine-rich repeat domain-containing protein [Kofleriaceae bacterium]|nr:leucine-rich repeat domain-containing protein [Kofleriaceae bacterium]
MGGKPRSAWLGRLRQLLDGLTAVSVAPPLDAAALAALEHRLGAALDAEHRTFLAAVCSGVAHAGVPLLLTPEQGLAELGGGRGRTDAPFASEGDGVDGALPIGGDPHEQDCLVLNGPERGRMWRTWDQGWTPLRDDDGEPLGFAAWAEQQLTELRSYALLEIGPETREINLVGKGLPAVPDAVFTAVAVERMILSGALPALPAAIGGLTQLRELVASGVGLAAIAPELGRARALRRLVLSSNRLAALPDSIGELAALEHLDIGRNQLTALPDGVGRLHALHTLRAEDNQLAALPAAVAALPALRELVLGGVWNGGNPLTALPDGAWPALHRLHLNDCAVRRLPRGLAAAPLREVELARMPDLDLADAVDVLSGCHDLQTLRLDELRRPLPPLSRLTSLRWLRLIDVELTELPDLSALTRLETLSLDQNRLTTLPAALGALPALRSIVLFGNPLDPAEVARLRAAWPHIEIDWAP